VDVWSWVAGRVARSSSVKVNDTVAQLPLGRRFAYSELADENQSSCKLSSACDVTRG